MKYRYREPHEMKDSGVEWLGMIPKEWEVKQLKYLAYSLNGFAFKSENYINHGVPIIRIGDISKVINLDNIPKVKEEIDLEKYKIKKQDILVALTGATIGKSCIYNLEEKSYLNQRVGLFRGIKIYNKFLFYYISSDMVLKYIQLICNGSAQENISNLDILNFKIALTYLNQQKIADFLDKKCEEFDSVIAKKEMLINKLEEAKKSLISEVVTGKVKVIEKENGEYGIIKREAHEMKDSGVEWLGMIPKEWGTSKLKNKLVKFTDGAHISPEVENGVYPFLSVKDLKNGVLDFKNCLKTSIESYKYLKRNSCKPEKGDLLISKDGTIGKTCIIDYDKDFVVASSLVIIKSKKNFSIKYLDYILQSEVSQKQIFQYVKGAALPRISLELLKNIYIPFINQQDEQIKINNLLDKKCSQFNIAIEKQKESIEKLKSAKQSLISEAVTGKIEVL